MQSLGRQVSGKRSKQGDCDLHGRIIQMPVYPAHCKTDEQPECNAAGCNPHEPERCMSERESSGCQCGNRELQCDQRRRVIHETFPFENTLDVMRHGKSAEDGCG